MSWIPTIALWVLNGIVWVLIYANWRERRKLIEAREAIPQEVDRIVRRAFSTPAMKALSAGVAVLEKAREEGGGVADVEVNDLAMAMMTAFEIAELPEREEDQ